MASAAVATLGPILLVALLVCWRGGAANVVSHTLPPSAALPSAHATGEDANSTEYVLNDRPIIGIVTQELPRGLRKSFGNRTSYLAASYVKYLEMAGARVVPIRIYQSEEYYSRLFGWLNGLLIPGGSAKLDGAGYGKTAKIFWNLAKLHSNVYFPIWGTCLGFEMLTFLELGANLLTKCSSQNQPLPLNFTKDGQTSRMFAMADASTRQIFERQNVTANYHRYCVAPEVVANTSFPVSFRVIATNRDINGQQFISAIEHKRRPVYGTQFHPEKNIFEWGTRSSISAIPHWPEAIKASQYLANFFVNEARKNTQRFVSERAAAKYLIYNYQPINTGATGSVFQQCYFFD